MNPTLGDQIARSLRDIRSAWPEMILLGPKGQGGPSVGGSKEPPPPAPIATLSLRREVTEILASWCHVVLDDAVDVNEDGMNVNLDSKDAVSMAGWLLTWADFLGEHVAAEEAAAEIGKAARSCKDIAEGAHRRRFKVGSCIEHGTSEAGERAPCTGTLYAYFGETESVATAKLVCNADSSHYYESPDWMALGRRLTLSA